MQTPLTIFGTHDESTIQQITRAAADPRTAGTALMADAHKGYSLPIGAVWALDNAVSPSGVGYDIACGVMAVKTDLRLTDALPTVHDRERLAGDIARTVAFGLGRTSGANVDHELFDDPRWREPHLAPLRQRAQAQLGTVGSGNHFADVLGDDAGALWVMVHFGSRGFGHGVASGFLNLAAGRAFTDKAPGESMDQPPVIFGLDTDLGQTYWRAMDLAGRYAYAGREYVIGQLLGLLGAMAVDTVHIHHNYAWRERHGGREVIVIRKGATPLTPGQRGALGGSMGDVSAIVRGVESPEAVQALHSAPHGAGRVMSRTQARGKVNRRTGAVKAPGQISQAMMEEWLQRVGVVRRGGDVDESPHVYRRLPEVLAAHATTLEVETWLHPVIVVMAGANVIDPFKD